MNDGGADLDLLQGGTVRFFSKRGHFLMMKLTKMFRIWSACVLIWHDRERYVRFVRVAVQRAPGVAFD